MMSLLVLDVTNGCVHLRPRIRKCAEPFLPVESPSHPTPSINKVRFFSLPFHQFIRRKFWIQDFVSSFHSGNRKVARVNQSQLRQY